MTFVLRFVFPVLCIGLISIRGIWDMSVKILRTKNAKKNILWNITQSISSAISVLLSGCLSQTNFGKGNWILPSFGRRNILGIYIVFKVTNCFFKANNLRSFNMKVISGSRIRRVCVYFVLTACLYPMVWLISCSVNLLKTERILLYIKKQSVPRCKYFTPRL
jgi:hypothetical protein